MQSLFFFISMIIYLISSGAVILFFLFPKLNKINLLTVILCSGFVFHTIGIIIRTVNSSHLPVSNVYETMILLSWFTVIISIIIKVKLKSNIVLYIASFLAFITICAASMMPENYKAINPLVPALQSYWLEFHVITCIIGYAAFAVSFILSLLYIIKHFFSSYNLSFAKRLPDYNTIDRLSYKLITAGFPFLTLGIITGAIWAKFAWGRYWGWDPKETWALVTWLIYTVYLHTRLIAGWKGFRSNLISVTGFISVIVTYFGVNFIIAGLHSYSK